MYLVSFKYCGNLVTIHNSVGLLHKLKVLDAEGCSKIKKFPPLQLPSLEQLKISYCSRLESFPEILVKMENMTELDLTETPIKEFPSSFRNLSGLQRLKLNDEESVQFAKSSILMMPQLTEIYTSLVEVSQVTIRKDEEVLYLEGIRSNEFLAFCLTWCANLKELKLYKSDITVVPECIKECRFLWKLTLDDCKQLEEIRGIPPSLQEICLIGCEKLEEIRGIPFPHSLEYLDALGCFSLSLSCRSMLLNQKMHEAGNTFFILPSPSTRGIPEWFEHQSRGPPIYFWFRNKFPHIALCVCAYEDCIDTLYINGKQFDYKVYYEIDSTDDDNDSTDDKNDYTDDDIVSTDDDEAGQYHTDIIHIGAKNLVGKECTLDEALLKNKWNEVEVILHSMYFKFQKPISFGIHVLNGRSSNIRFTNPYKKRKSDLNLPPLAENDVNTELTL